MKDYSTRFREVVAALREKAVEARKKAAGLFYLRLNNNITRSVLMDVLAEVTSKVKIVFVINHFKEAWDESVSANDVRVIDAEISWKVDQQ